MENFNIIFASDFKAIFLKKGEAMKAKISYFLLTTQCWSCYIIDICCFILSEKGYGFCKLDIFKNFLIGEERML